MQPDTPRIFARASDDGEQPWESVRQLFASLLRKNRDLEARVAFLERTQRPDNRPPKLWTPGQS
jgi:hypothetical protein